MWVEINIAISAEYLSARRRSLKQFDGLDHRRTNRPKVPLRRQRPRRLQAQVLTILDQILHCLVYMSPFRMILPLDQTDAALVTVPFLVMVAAVGIALTMSDLLPQLADPSCLTDIPAHYVAIEVVGHMDVVPTPLLAIPCSTE